MQHSNKYWLFILPILAVCINLALQMATPFKKLELAYDDLLVSQPTSLVQPSDDIIILSITEDTMEKFAYRAPFDRGFLAKIVSKLYRANVHAIGIDILFDQPTEPEKDRALQAAFGEASKILFVATANREDGLSENQLAYQTDYLAGINAANIILVKSNYDGIVRHAFSQRRQGDQLIPNLARAMSGSKNDSSVSDPSRISYYSTKNAKPYQFKTFPAETIDLLPDEWFDGKYVLIGMNLPGVDQFRTPFATRLGEAPGTLSGVTVHANILNQHLLDLRITETPYLVELFAIFAAAVLGAVLALMDIPISLRLFPALIIAVGVLVVPYFLFPQSHTLVPAVSIATSLLLAVALGMLMHWHFERKQRQFVTGAWSKYVSPSVVDELLANPTKLETGGERRDISVIFTDIANFTSMVEATPVDQLTPVLNQYLDRVSTEFLNAGATLDKFVGDAVVGFFGAPIDDVDHPDKAVTLAIKLDRICRDFQQEHLPKKISFGRTRIGVHSGTAIVGNFGGDRFFDYTVIGDAVNIAARLEGANKMWGGNVCVSGDTSKRALRHTFRPIGHLHLAGKSNLIDAWEPLLLDNENIAEPKSYTSAYNNLEQGDPGSLETYKELNDAYPKDHLVTFYLERLRKGEQGTMIKAGK